MVHEAKEMNQEEILESYSLFELPEKKDESYQGAEIFGAQFKRCTILKDVPTLYSNTTTYDKK